MKKLTLLFSLLSSLITLAEDIRPEKPNFVFFFIDDLGWQDVSSYDIETPNIIETPQIDSIAEKGVLFWQAYSPSPTCTPSRAAVLSGIHPARSQCTHISGGVLPQIDKKNKGILITPWYSGRMATNQPSIAGVLKAGGYATGHTGKWHVSANLHSFPTPTDVGFDFTTHDKDYMSKYEGGVRGIQRGFKGYDKRNPGKERIFEYSTKDSGFPLNEDGYPTDPVQLETIQFLENNKAKPFFLYNATWLVHAPIQSRSEALVKKYYDLYLAEVKRKNVERTKTNLPPLKPLPLDSIRWKERGWNPFYLAMIETLDHQIGQTLDYLRKTDDPRWNGHKLIENTYIIFTSDNGGVISARAEQITDNAPLTYGKKYTREGGVRVPFIIAGPDIKKGAKSNVLVNGLDLYPTIIDLAGVKKPEGAVLDGLNLTPLLKRDPADANLVKYESGEPRTEMFWHFPHTTQCSASLRDAQYKAIYNFGAEFIPTLEPIELYQLYGPNNERGDLEEAKPIHDPALIAKYKTKIESYLQSYGATLPHYNVNSKALPKTVKNKVPLVQSSEVKDGRITLKYKEQGSKVARAFLLYKVPHPVEKPEWLRQIATIDQERKQVVVSIAKESLAAEINLIDENHVLVSEKISIE